VDVDVDVDVDVELADVDVDAEVFVDEVVEVVLVAEVAAEVAVVELEVVLVKEVSVPLVLEPVGGVVGGVEGGAAAAPTNGPRRPPLLDKPELESARFLTKRLSVVWSRRPTPPEAWLNALTDEARARIANRVIRSVRETERFLFNMRELECCYW